MRWSIRHDDETFERDPFSSETWHHDGFGKSLTWGSITTGHARKLLPITTDFWKGSILKTILKNTKNKPKLFAIILVLGWDKDEYVCNRQGMHRRAFLSLMMENLLQFWPPCMGSRRFQKVRGTCILDGYHTWALGEMETCIRHDDETFERDPFSSGTWHHDGFGKSLTWGRITTGHARKLLPVTFLNCQAFRRPFLRKSPEEESFCWGSMHTTPGME